MRLDPGGERLSPFEMRPALPLRIDRAATLLGGEEVVDDAIDEDDWQDQQQRVAQQVRLAGPWRRNFSIRCEECPRATSGGVAPATDAAVSSSQRSPVNASSA